MGQFTALPGGRPGRCAALAQLSSDPKLKAMGTLLMLGPVAASAGVLGALGTGLSVGMGVALAGQYGAEAHKFANELLDR